MNMEPRITDNRMQWAEKVLREQVPNAELETAVTIMEARAISDKDGWYTPFHPKNIQPRLIATNWNK